MSLKIIEKPISELKPAPYNPRRMSKSQKEKLKQSISHFGFIDPLIWNKRTGHVVGGNQRLEVLKELGYKTVPVVEVDLPFEEEKRLNIALNKISGDWDREKLEELLSELEKLGDIELTGFDLKEVDAILGRRNPYSKKIESPIYRPQGWDVELKDLVDDEKYKSLLKKIEESSLSKDEKNFLKLAATRFLVFRYDYIAEYYAKASKEMQELMEELALVIVDFNKAVELGFIELEQSLWETFKEEWGER